MVYNENVIAKAGLNRLIALYFLTKSYENNSFFCLSVGVDLSICSI